MDRAAYIRVWEKLELDYITKHLLIAGDPTGDCANCKEVGINIQAAKSCPKCNTLFKYVATRLQNNASQARKLKMKRQDLVAIDLLDYKEAYARQQAHRFMKD